MSSRRVQGRAVAAAVLATATGALPAFLLGGLAVQVRAELQFSEAQLGLSVTLFFGVSALASLLAGRAVERLGARGAMAVTGVLTSIGLVGVGLATSWHHVLTAFVIAGIGNAFSQPAANLMLARGVTYARQGLVFGIKQSAVTLTTLLGGLAVPVFALTVGWRWAFAAGVAMAALLFVLPPRELTRHPRASAQTSGPGSSTSTGSRRTLVLLAAAAGLAALGANTLGVFLVETAVARGIAEAPAAALLVLGSVLAIGGRVIGGWFADRTRRALLPIVATMLLVGAVGHAGLAVGQSGVVLAGATVLAFGAGWGWNGLFTFAVVEAYRAAPAAATGVTQAGIFVGATIGPGLFGLVAEAGGFALSWSLMASLSALAGLGMLLVQRTLPSRVQTPSHKEIQT